MANSLQVKSYVAFVNAIEMDTFVLRVRFSGFFLSMPRSDSLFVSILSLHKCVWSKSLSVCHSSVVLKLFLVRPYYC